MDLAAVRFGYTVQLCYLRHLGRSPLPSEAVPAAMLSLHADQIGCRIDDLANYSARATTLREHRAEVEAYLGRRAVDGLDPVQEQTVLQACLRFKL